MSLAFDIGANVGSKIELLLQRYERVVAVEPVRACHEVLVKKFPSVIALNKAVGAQEGRGKIRLCNPIEDPLCACSSMSRRWVESVKGSERFFQGAQERYWSAEQDVEVTTLDRLIESYGSPTFIKVDVEGYELEVLKGLSRPVPELSFEFTPEVLDDTFACIDRCAEIGMRHFGLMLGEEYGGPSQTLFTGEDLKKQLQKFAGSNKIYGDVYAYE